MLTNKIIRKIISAVIGCVLFLSLNAELLAQENDSLKIHPWKITLIGTVSTGAFVYGHLLQEDIWWKGEKSKFHSEWKYDWSYALGSDKLGHFYFPYLVANVYSELFQWSGVGREKSHWYSSGLAFAYQSYIEVRDGFSKEWGFSWGDFIANTAGAMYPLLAYYSPVLNTIRFKVSYYPSPRFRNNSHNVIIDDYESTYHWISLADNSVIPGLNYLLPDFVSPTVGHSVKKLDISDERTHEFFLGIEFNPDAILWDFWLWQGIQKFARYYHLPSPVVKIYPDVIWYGLKF